MNLARLIPKFLTGIAVVLLAMFFMGSTAFAIDKPPQDSQQQRAWIVGHLVTDMQALGTFDGDTLAKVPAIVDALTDDQVALLSQYYFLTRSKTAQDASLYAMQQQGETEEQVNDAKAEIADLLTAMNDQIEACYDQIASMPQPVQYVAQICYASVPGWCCQAQCFVPDWYYDNGCFVGPCFSAACSGSWAVPVCNAYYDHGSHFYTTYHNVANKVHIERSINVAKRRANWLRHHGDWHNTLAHDRLVQQPAHKLPPPLSSSAQKHIANRKPVVHKQVAKPHVPARHPAKVVQHAAKSPANHAPASHAHAPRPATHVARPRPAVHASHPRPVAHAPAHTRSGGHSKHR